MIVPEEQVRAALNPAAALDADEEQNMRQLLARPFDFDSKWAWQWVCRLLATIDKLRGHVTCSKCGGGGFDGVAICADCLGDGATRLTSASASEATPASHTPPQANRD